MSVNCSCNVLELSLKKIYVLSLKFFNKVVSELVIGALHSSVAYQIKELDKMNTMLQLPLEACCPKTQLTHQLEPIQTKPLTETN